MTSPMLKEHRIYREQVIKMTETEFHPKTMNSIKTFLIKEFKDYFTDDVLLSQRHSYVKSVGIYYI